MKRLLLTVMFLAPLALAQQPPAQPEDPDRGGTTTMEKETDLPEEQLRKLSVTVKAVDPVEHRVTFEARVSPEANIEQSGRPIKLDSLQPGDEVRASFDPRTGEMVKLEVIKKGEPPP